MRGIIGFVLIALAVLLAAGIVALSEGNSQNEAEIISKDEVQPGDYAALKLERGWKIYQLLEDGSWREVEVSL